MSHGSQPVVVVGVDGSELSRAAVEWAERYARDTGARLRLVTVWEWPVQYGLTPTYDESALATAASHVAEKAAAGLSLPPDRVETKVVPGPPGRGLVKEAAGAALLVVGSRGHGLSGDLLLGSVSRYCLHHATIPIVVVR